ncbi:hypothetical protein NHX12_010235, partial [Muraenolepis orangiensis]
MAEPTCPQRFCLSPSQLTLHTEATYDLKPRPNDLKPRPNDLKPRPKDFKPRPNDLKPRPYDLKPAACLLGWS